MAILETLQPTGDPNEPMSPPEGGIAPSGGVQAVPDEPSGAPEMSSEGDATPEEQRQYDLLVSNALEFIYGEKTGDSVLKMLANGPPPQAIANVVSMVGAGLKKAADNVSQPVSPDAMLGAATEVIDNLMDLGQAAGIFQFNSQQEVDQTAKEALMLTVKQFGEGLLATPNGKALQSQAQQTVNEKLQQEQQGPKLKPFTGLVNQAMGGNA